MKTAKEMTDFCKKYKFGKSSTESWTIKHFSVIEKQLSSGEDVILCFMGLHNYISMTNHDKNFAYAITNKRIIMAQKKAIGEVVQTVLLDNVNDITYKKGLVLGVITIDSIKEKFNVALENSNSDKLYNLIHELIYKLKGNKSSVPTDDYKKLEELKRLLDRGVITQKDFDLKKKQILNL